MCAVYWDSAMDTVDTVFVFMFFTLGGGEMGNKVVGTWGMRGLDVDEGGSRVWVWGARRGWD